MLTNRNHNAENSFGIGVVTTSIPGKTRLKAKACFGAPSSDHQNFDALEFSSVKSELRLARPSLKWLGLSNSSARYSLQLSSLRALAAEIFTACAPVQLTHEWTVGHPRHKISLVCSYPVLLYFGMQRDEFFAKIAFDRHMACMSFKGQLICSL